MTNRLQVAFPHFRRYRRGVTGAIQPDTERELHVPPRLPRLARLMALALRCDGLVRAGTVKDYATLAQLGNVSRARISQIMNLIHLAPAIQEALLFLPPISRGRAPVVLADMQPITVTADWAKQRQLWRAACASRKLNIPSAGDPRT